MKIIKFDYREFGNKDKVRAYSIELEGDAFIVKLKKDNKVFSLDKSDVEKLLSKYDWGNIEVEELYPFKITEQIDYRLKLFYDNGDVIEKNGYSHYPSFYNEFISDLAKIGGGRSIQSLKVKEDMLDKNEKYITNYVEKISIFTNVGDVVIAKDRLSNNEFNCDVMIPRLDKYFRKNDLSFVLPIDVHYMSYIINKKCNLHEIDSIKRVDEEFYIDIRLHNKKHRYYSLSNENNKNSLKILINYLKLFSSLPVFDAYIDESFIEKYLNEHKLPKTRNELNDEFSNLLDSGTTLLDALKLIAKENTQFSMFEIISLAYQNQNYFYSYIYKAGKIKEFIISSEKTKEINKIFKQKDLNELSIFYLDKDYDVLYYLENGEIHFILTSSKYEDLKYLKLKDSYKEKIKNEFDVEINKISNKNI